MADEKRLIQIPEKMTVSRLADLLEMPASDLIGQLLEHDILASVHEEVDAEEIKPAVEDLGYEVEIKDIPAEDFELDMGEGSDKQSARPPVITVLGHVDHGKTSLLDNIRKTRVAEKESGGITQHIGAYQIEREGKTLTFLDTPGHEAFSVIRAQGARVTDIVVLVVAADDGVQPQTKEAINLIKAADVEVVVAITKIDKPEAQVEKVKQELSDFEIIPEDWGGDTTMVEVSNETGEGIDELLEMIQLTSDLLELQASFEGDARGVIIESERDPQVGPKGTVLIRSGTLQVGDAIVAGTSHGKVKFMEDEEGERVKEAVPGTPVRVVGFKEDPEVGSALIEVKDIKAARELVDSRKGAEKRSDAVSGKDEVNDLAAKLKASTKEEITVVLKADTAGSLEAIHKEIAQIKTDKGELSIVSSGLGDITKSDISAAAGGNAVVIGFKVDVASSARDVAEREEVTVKTYDVIYNLIDDLKTLLQEALGPETIKEKVGQGKVLEIFRDDSNTKIIGIKVTKGKARIGNQVQIYRDGEDAGSGKVSSIQHLNEKINEARSEGEFGFEVNISHPVEQGDKIEFFEVEEKYPELNVKS